MIDDRFEWLVERRKAFTYGTTRRWSEDYERVGVIGEWIIAIFFRARPDQRHKPGGDRGVDLWLLMDFGNGRKWYRVDAKAAQFPKELLVAQDKLAYGRNADTIYILVGPSVDFWNSKGWEWGAEMVLCPLKKWSGNDRWVHHKPKGELRGMDELQKAYCGEWAWNEENGQRGEIKRAIPPDEVREWIEALKSHCTLSTTATAASGAPSDTTSSSSPDTKDDGSVSSTDQPIHYPLKGRQG